jgi:hypothetical protein
MRIAFSAESLLLSRQPLLVQAHLRLRIGLPVGKTPRSCPQLPLPGTKVALRLAFSQRKRWKVRVILRVCTAQASLKPTISKAYRTRHKL